MSVKRMPMLFWIQSVKINYARLQMCENKMELKTISWKRGAFRRQTRHWEILLRNSSVYLRIPSNQDCKVIKYEPWVDTSSLGVRLPV